jgi:hypothetical protein
VVLLCAPSYAAAPCWAAVSAAAFDTAGPVLDTAAPGLDTAAPGSDTATRGWGTAGSVLDSVSPGAAYGTAGARHPRAALSPAGGMLPPPPSRFRPCGRGASGEEVPRPGPGLVPPTGSPGPVQGMPRLHAGTVALPAVQGRRRVPRPATPAPAAAPTLPLPSGHAPCDPALLGPDATPPAAPDTELDARGAAATARESRSSPGCDPGATDLRARRRPMCVS